MTESTSQSESSPSLMTVLDQLMFMDQKPEVFLTEMLSFQRQLTGATQAALLRLSDKGVELVLLHPPLHKEMPPPPWIEETVKHAEALTNLSSSTVIPLHDKDALYGQHPEQCIIALPCMKAQGHIHAMAFYFQTADPAIINQARLRLELTIALPNVYELNQRFHGQGQAMKRMDTAVQVSANINEPPHFKGVAMALCNELAARFNADRVSIGFMKGRYIKVQAISHTEKFTRKMKLTQDLEATMEECFDQDAEVIYPPLQDAPYVYRSTTEHAHRHGPMCILTLPLRHDAEPFGVLMLERNPDKLFTPEEFQVLRLICELSATRLFERERADVWIGARLARQTKEAAAFILGPKYTWVKIAALLVLAGIITLAVIRGEDKIESTFQVQSSTRYVIPVPFDAKLQEVYVEPGDEVTDGQLLAELDTVELHEQLTELTNQARRYETEQRLALRENKVAEQQIAEAKLKSVQAQMQLLKFHIAQSKLKATQEGMILSGDWKRKIGQPMSRGDLVFEIGPKIHDEAELVVTEDRIADVLAVLKKKPLTDLNQADTTTSSTQPHSAITQKASPVVHGYLSPASDPEAKVPFQITRISPVAEVVGQQNVFRVQIRLLASDTELRPGMQGIAKINAGEKLYINIWTRELVNWVRMKLWI